eukprot:5709342-Pyramimonas_sp.AAC.2
MSAEVGSTAHSAALSKSLPLCAVVHFTPISFLDVYRDAQTRLTGIQRSACADIARVPNVAACHPRRAALLTRPSKTSSFYPNHP